MATIKTVQMNSTAVALAHKVSEATMSDMTGLMEAKEETQRGPLVILLDIRKDLGAEGMASVPLMDSVNPDKGPPVTNNPDGYYRTKTLANGGSRDVRAWWHNDFADSTTTGQPINIGDRPSVVGGVEIDGVLAELTKKISDELVKGSDKVSLKKERAYWQGRKSTNRNTYKKAFAVHQRGEDFVKTPKLSWRILTDEDKTIEQGGVPSSSKTPIKVWEKDSPEEYVLWSVQTFLNCDPVLAQNAGGSLNDLIETVSRDGTDQSKKTVESLKLTELERECQRLNKLLSQDGIGILIKRMALAKDTGKVFAHIFTETSLLMQAAVSEASLMPLFEEVEKQAA